MWTSEGKNVVVDDLDELKGNVERFVGFFRDQLKVIQITDFKESTSVFRKILYYAVLDGLSKTIASRRKGNRGRIVTLIRRFCRWSTSEKISLPHLVKLLEKVAEPEFRDLREYAFSLCEKWGEGEVMYLEKDPEFQDVKKRWPKDIPKPFKGIQIGYLRHVNLFYNYRNYLMHELRQPGYGMEFEDNIPFYH